MVLCYLYDQFVVICRFSLSCFLFYFLFGFSSIFLWRMSLLICLSYVVYFSDVSRMNLCPNIQSTTNCTLQYTLKCDKRMNVRFTWLRTGSSDGLL
jgi:hypothetical protein